MTLPAAFGRRIAARADEPPSWLGRAVEAGIIDRTDLPVYLRIADCAEQLRALGMSDRAIAGAFGVSGKAVPKAAGEAEASGTGMPTGAFQVIERVPAGPAKTPRTPLPPPPFP